MTINLRSHFLQLTMSRKVGIEDHTALIFVDFPRPERPGINVKTRGPRLAGWTG
jgi:hypothetical protein